MFDRERVEPIGKRKLQKAAGNSGTYDWSRTGDLIGRLFGGYTKSMVSGG